MFVVIVPLTDFIATDKDELYAEPFLFQDEDEADKFVDHLNDLYDFNVRKLSVTSTNYDSAIEMFVDMYGPSEE